MEPPCQQTGDSEHKLYGRIYPERSEGSNRDQPDTPYTLLRNVRGKFALLIYVVLRTLQIKCSS